MKSLSFDVLVVGAGPAGCAAAIRAATRGMAVGLVERARFPRHLPGEALHPDIDFLFDELGVRNAVTEAAFIRFPGWILERQGESTYVPFGEPLTLRFGYQAWRSELDSILLARARRSGVSVFQQTRAHEVLISGGRVIGLLATDRCLTARHIIDATGARRWLSKKLSKTPKSLSPRLVARYGYSDRDFGLGSMPIFREHRNGWTWLAKVRRNTCQCVQLSMTPGTDVPALPDNYGFPEKLRGADVTWRLLEDCARPGYFICGDAAAILDPVGSRGVARALETGIKAAESVADIRDGKISETDASDAYRGWLAGKIYTEARQLASRHSMLKDSPGWVRHFDGHP